MTPPSTPWGVRRLLIAGLAALAVLGSGLAPDAAGAKKKKKQRAAGIYVGETNHVEFTTVRFRLTPQGGIVDFTVPNVPMGCNVAHSYEVGDTTYYSKVDTLAAPPMSIGPVGKKLPIDRRFHYEDPLPPPPPTFGSPPPLGSPPYRGIYVDALSTVIKSKPFYTGPLGPGFKGRANLATYSDTRGAFGTEECHASSSLWDPGEYKPGFEWTAVKQVKRKKK